MGKILKNIVPYWKTVVLVIVLLAVQAYCDLALPTYTSDIIDVGIQNRGVEHIIPEKIMAEDYQKATFFMEDDEKELWESLYTKEEDNYELKSFTKDELNDIDESLMIPIAIVYQASQMDQKDMADQMAGYQGSQEDLVKTIRGEIQKQVDTIGSDTLMAMGAKYAADCNEKAGIDVDAMQKSYLWASGARMFGIALVMLLAAICVAFLASRVGAGVGRDLRFRVFSNVVGYSNGEMDKFSAASLITRNTNDVQQVQMVVSILLRMLLYAPILAIGGIYKVWQTGAGMGWIIGLAVLVILGFVMLLVSIAMPKFKIMQTLVDNLNLVSREILTGLSVIRAFGREEAEEKRFDTANTELKKTQLFTNRVMTFMMPGMTLIMNCLVVLITWTAAHKIDEGNLQVGVMTAFIIYSMLIVMSFLMMTMMSILLPRAGVAAERIEEVIKTKSSIVEKEEVKTIDNVKGILEFHDVSFEYPNANENAINHVSFKAEPGKVTAIIGSTGSGKSTLVNLIPRFYDVTEGSITLDGVDIRDLSLEQLREAIGFVPQKGVLFSGTIDSNLRFGKEDATEDEIKLAAKIAQSEEFIESKPHKYEESIAQGGSNVSGGQKQRLAIARAIAKQPEVFVFDDSFSALDMKTDAALRKALGEHVKDSTEIIVAQRISTILHADQIIVVDEGEIVGMGTHSKLMKNCTVYREIAESQLSAKEIEKMLKEVGINE